MSGSRATQSEAGAVAVPDGEAIDGIEVMRRVHELASGLLLASTRERETLEVLLASAYREGIDKGFRVGKTQGLRLGRVAPCPACEDRATCAECGASLIDDDGPFTCEDCAISDENLIAWEERRSARRTSPAPESEFHGRVWRTGRRNGHTIYADDQPAAFAITRECAALLVDDANIGVRTKIGRESPDRGEGR